MSRRVWLPAIAALAVAAAPAAAQDGLGLIAAVQAALASHPSLIQERAALESAALSLRMAEIEHDNVTVSLRATPVTGGVSLSAWEDGPFGDVFDTFDADASGTLSAQVDLPWGMSIAGSYTAGVELDDLDSRGSSDEERFTDAQRLTITQDLLPAGKLAPSAIALAGRRDDLRLARLRLASTQSDVAQQVAQTFVGLTGRAAALAVAEERLAIAERELANTRSLVEEQAADRIALLSARITAIERRNAVADARASLALDVAAFFSDLDLPEAPLVAPEVDADALRRAAHDLVEASAGMADPDGALAVLEARARLDAARLQLAQARRGSLPSLSLSLDYTKGSGAPGLGGLSVSLTGSYTLYDGGKQAIAVQQAEAQADSAQRALVSAQSTAAAGLQRARLDLQRAIADEELAALRWERARLQADQAARRHRPRAPRGNALAAAGLPPA
ncbi:MAG: TolC family protein, partial [Spirochaetaceae bacterium]|nr:TolC family protein [Spirochaetaceae bacterium]